MPNGCPALDGWSLSTTLLPRYPALHLKLEGIFGVCVLHKKKINQFCFEDFNFSAVFPMFEMSLIHSPPADLMTSLCLAFFLSL